MLHTRYSLIKLMGIDDEVLSAAGSMMRDKGGGAMPSVSRYSSGLDRMLMPGCDRAETSAGLGE